MFHLLGLTLLIVSGVMVVPIPVAFIFNELSVIPSFAVPAAIAALIGFFLWKKFELGGLNYGKAMVIAASAWLIISFFGSIPFFMSAGLDPISAYFESMSGFTTTGLTMFEMSGPGMISAPNTILFWRSLTQWVGGIGIMVLFLSLIVGAGGVAKRLFSAEGGGGRYIKEDKGPAMSLLNITRSVWKIYVFLTLASIVLFYLLDMPLFESINHSMTALATGGFSVTSDSFVSYSAPILIATLFPMILGATNFIVHIRVFKGDWKAFFKNTEFKLLLFLIGVSTFILAWTTGVVDGIFSAVTASTTVGFSSVGQAGIVNGPGWGPLQKSIIVVLMVIGGGFGSTAGAIKLIRTVVLILALYWLVKKAILPDRAVVPFKLGNRVFSNEEILQTAVFVFAYILLLVLGSLITMAALPNESAINCIFDSASAQGTVGLSAGITGIGMPVVVKITYIIQMWIGRLEVIPVITLISYFIGKVDRREPF